MLDDQFLSDSLVFCGVVGSSTHLVLFILAQAQQAQRLDRPGRSRDHADLARGLLGGGGLGHVRVAHRLDRRFDLGLHLQKQRLQPPGAGCGPARFAVRGGAAPALFVVPISRHVRTIAHQRPKAGRRPR
ncbi:MAG: hypothetical protein DI624_11555 [Brevundimonas sp.]|nr:MAG: hypothetical protein DI624_11555 [Brevundimonas sp.]